MSRLERIRTIGEPFSPCGDYLQDAAGIRCTSPGCGHDCFRPISRKGFYLFSEVSRLIYDIIGEFCHEAAARSLLTGIVVAQKPFGDMLGWIPHFHAGCMAER